MNSLLFRHKHRLVHWERSEGICFRHERQESMAREFRFYVYIMASKSRAFTPESPTTSSGEAGEIEGFTRRYKINRLVHYEVFQYIGNAIGREKEIKGWDRAKRVALIERENPTWDDLAHSWGKPIELLKPVAVEMKADPSLLHPSERKIGARQGPRLRS